MEFHPRYGPDDGVVATFEVEVADGLAVQLRGRRVGFATSRLERHNHVGERQEPNAGPRCSACRWFEVHLFKTAEDEYVVHTAGMSTFAGEVPLIKMSRTRSPYEVVEILTIRRNGDVQVPAPSARVLAQAAHFDAGIRQAYELGPIPSHLGAA